MKVDEDVRLVTLGVAAIGRPRRFERLTDDQWLRVCSTMTGRLIRMLKRGAPGVAEDAEVAGWTLELLAAVGRAADKRIGETPATNGKAGG